ncbi:hypothetical protein [Streptomyces atratus]|uniref:hypothetical protein n=1 Tax=Streptomyces atratus TaxID=1893 RepID=UPI001300543E|nr:hypothetical protein [Streptomyces atratus]
MLPGTTTYAKVKSGKQTLRSGIAGVDPDGCKPGAGWNAIVTWNLGKVTKDSIRVNSINIRHSNGRKLNVGSLSIVDDTKTVWNKGYGWYLPKGAINKPYTINKTLKVKKHKAYLVIRGQIADAPNERIECHQITRVYFYLKQKS